MPVICIVVPVYNAEETLERCVGSILDQTFADFSIILVDDGSTDNSGAICDAYAEREPRITTLHTQNRGLSAARNEGIRISLSMDSKYLSFVDSDDYLEPNMLDALYASIVQSEADIVQCGWKIIGMRTTRFITQPIAEYNKQDAIRQLISGTIHSGVWNKLYRKDLFTELRFPEGRVYEDVATMHLLLLLCNKVVLIPTIGYNHVMRRGSITHTTTMKNLVDYWLAHKGRYDFFVGEKPITLDEETLNSLSRIAAFPISRMWRWAYGNQSYERAKYLNYLNEMQRFERENLRDVKKTGWPIHVRLMLVLSRSTSTFSLAVGYYINQIYIMLFPMKSGSKQ